VSGINYILYFFLDIYGKLELKVLKVKPPDALPEKYKRQLLAENGDLDLEYDLVRFKKVCFLFKNSKTKT
jgi:hypothetical protein